MIKAVSLSITLPANMDALSTATKPLHRGAVMNAHEVRSLCPAGFGPLIRAVGAVAVPVAGP